MAGIEVSKAGVDWVDKQLRAELDNLQQSKFDKNISIKYLQKLKNKSSYNELMKDNSWATIVAVQVLLKELGFYNWKIDGILKTKWKVTSQTMEAVRAFQRKNGLTPDGVPGPSTIRKLLEKFGSWASNTPKPVVPNNPKPVTPNNPKTPEKQAQNAEATLADLKNFNPYSVWNFDKNENFVFKKWVEKSDSKWKYILVNGKKLYELGNNKDGLYYEKSATWGVIFFSEYKNWKKNWLWTMTSPNWAKYVGQWKNNDREWQWTETYPDWAKYVGQWKNDDRDWQWTMTYPDWEKYVGQWKNDEQEWQWTFTYLDWEKYVGQWKNDNFWTWCRYAKDGKTVLEKWVNWKIV